MENADQENHQFYSRLADTWWDKQGPFWPIHTLNSVRVRYLRDWMQRHFHLEPANALPLQGLNILDMGCGGGVLSESMARLGANVTGADVVERNIQVARHHALQEGINVDYRVSSAVELVDSGCRYDAVLCMEVVEHVADLEAFLQSCNQLVRPGGLMYIATINRTVLAWFMAILGAEYLLGWLPRGTHQWRKFRKPGELDSLLRQNDLRVLDRVGVLINPLRRTMAISPVTSVNYMLVANKPGASSAGDLLQET